MEEVLIRIKNEADALILEAEDNQELNNLKMAFLGKKGKMTMALKELTKIPLEKRAEIGKLANEIKNSLEELLKFQEEKIKQTEKGTKQKDTLDITLPGEKPALGHLHLITQAIDEITSIFEKIGFERMRYPEVEWDWYAFSALNFPENHPARDDWETFFIKSEPNKTYGQMLLTPHTSSGQIREMERKKPPIRMLNLAKCYRRQSDISHSPMFHQFEGLVVDKNIAITHLKGVLDYFVKSYFGRERKARIRPYHFQFTEPSFEVDVSCEVCRGTGKVSNEKCRLCKTGWLELGGAGMVHPNVLKNGKIDPKEYTGFAFGWGVERVLMMKEGIRLDDLRTLYSNNLDFLNQF